MDDVSSPWTSGFYESDSLRLHYLDTGGSGDVLLCLHGTSMSANCWTDLAARLSPSVRVVALDQRGHGRSERRSDASYSIAEYREDAAALISHLGVDRVTLLGSSLGTQVAASLASNYPALVSGVILSDPSFHVTSEEVVKYLRSHHFRPRTFSSKASAEAYARSLPQRSGLTERLHAMAIEGDFTPQADGTVSWAYDLSAITKTFLGLQLQNLDELAWIECPVLILNADGSNVLSRDDALSLKSSIATSMLVTIRNSNHTIWGDQPEYLAKVVNQFLKGAFVSEF